jgi:hypothetical protein
MGIARLGSEKKSAGKLLFDWVGAGSGGSAVLARFETCSSCRVTVLAPCPNKETGIELNEEDRYGGRNGRAHLHLSIFLIVCFPLPFLSAFLFLLALKLFQPANICSMSLAAQMAFPCGLILYDHGTDSASQLSGRVVCRVRVLKTRLPFLESTSVKEL